MMNRKIIALLGIILIFGVFLGYKIDNGLWIKSDNPSLEYSNINNGVHYHAGFVVFDNGKKVDFSDLKYMHIEKCNVDGSVVEEDTLEHEQIEKAHLHDKVGDVVHVHRSEAKWQDLFTNIKYPLDYSEAIAYINGIKIENFKEYPIKTNDSATIFIGSVDEKLLNQAVTADYIKEVELKSENCGT